MKLSNPEGVFFFFIQILLVVSSYNGSWKTFKLCLFHSDHKGLFFSVQNEHILKGAQDDGKAIFTLGLLVRLE